jgi:hypothetical protein
MDVDADTPSPKRRRTSSHNSSTLSSRQSSPAPLGANQSSHASPNTASHRLPLRRASSTGIRDGGRALYHNSMSRDGSPYPDESDEDNRRTYWRDRSPPPRRRRRSRRRDSSDSMPRSASTHSSVEASTPESRPYSPRPAPEPKVLRFKLLLNIDTGCGRNARSFRGDGV